MRILQKLGRGQPLKSYGLEGGKEMSTVAKTVNFIFPPTIRLAQLIWNANLPL